jgi:hypothetical protein
MPDFSSMPEAFVSNADLASAVSSELKHGTLRKLASRLYTRNLKEAPEKIVKRNLWPLVASVKQYAAFSNYPNSHSLGRKPKGQFQLPFNSHYPFPRVT